MSDLDPGKGLQVSVPGTATPVGDITARQAETWCCLLSASICVDLDSTTVKLLQWKKPGKHSSSRVPLLSALSIGVRGERRSNVFGQREKLHVNLVYLL